MKERKGGIIINREENIFLAKKLFVELVFNTAYIEGVNVTFPQTQTILDGGIVNDIAVSDIQTVLNLRDGWKYMLDNIDASITLDFVCNVNSYVSRNESLSWGTLRTGNVCISGTDYMPSVPVRESVEKQLLALNKIADPKEKAIEYFCYAVRNQLFWDGNKRTSTIIASKILIEQGAGVLTIDSRNALQFNEGLLCYYDTGNKEKLVEALQNSVKAPQINIEQKLELAKHKIDKNKNER